MEKLIFTVEPTGEEKEFIVIEDTRVNGANYLLVAEDDSDEALSYILKDVSAESALEAEYVMVEDDDEFDAVAGVFKELLEEYDLE